MQVSQQPTSTEPFVYDVLVVGGGINGVGIARDLAGSGWRVLLCEQDDLAAHTSSASTKLIHGGLRYLEHGEFGLVRKALIEREVLLKSAPHIMRPMRFIMPHDPAMRPAWLIRLGLFLYDHLARRKILPRSTGVALSGQPLGVPLKPEFKRGFVYSDGWVDDARLVVLTAVDAAARGARILTQTRCVQARRQNQRWKTTLQSKDGLEQVIEARALVNAAGPWAASFLQDAAHPRTGNSVPSHRLRLVKGSHIIVPRWFEHDHAYIFQNTDRRIMFAIPYEERFTLIGTTDLEFTGDPSDIPIAEVEVAYLCEQVSRYFKKAVTPTDVVWSYAGVRPLLEDAALNASEVTRDYVLEAQTEDGAPILTVWGGKLTTFRKLAEEASEKLSALLDKAYRPWTRRATLPGGDLSAWIAPSGRPQEDIAHFIAQLNNRYPWLPTALAQRYARSYGSLAARVLGTADSLNALGLEVAPGLYEAELKYLIESEWALNVDDILWRRTKLGLHYTSDQKALVTQWLASFKNAV